MGCPDCGDGDRRQFLKTAFLGTAGAVVGGPIFDWHQAGPSAEEKPDHPNNVYWYQAKRANEVFQALDGKQRAKALLDKPREEKATETVALKAKGEIMGLPVSDMH